ncbi:hypothetical protein D3C74_249370 [compost metagenome]
MGTASALPGTLNDFITTIKKFCKRLQLCNELYHIIRKMFEAEYSRRTNNRVELGHVLGKGEMPYGSRDRQARAARQLDMRRPHQLHLGRLLAAPAGLSVLNRLADLLCDASVCPVAPKESTGTKVAGCNALAAHLLWKCRDYCVRGANAPR